jgi:hypothetical protein
VNCLLRARMRKSDFVRMVRLCSPRTKVEKIKIKV